jgi:hypothetical protein
VGLQPFAQGHTQAKGQKAHQYVRLDPQLDVVADGRSLVWLSKNTIPMCG